MRACISCVRQLRLCNPRLQRSLGATVGRPFYGSHLKRNAGTNCLLLEKGESAQNETGYIKSQKTKCEPMGLTIRSLLACKYSINTDKGRLQRNKFFFLGIASRGPGTQRRADCIYKKEVGATSKKRESPLCLQPYRKHTDYKKQRWKKLTRTSAQGVDFV